jgi:hypothetical protein
MSAPAPTPAPTPTPTPAAPKRKFDQVLSGDVTIKKICNSDNDEYKITFSKKKKDISKVLMYQVWSDSNTPEGKYLNEHREVFEVKATKWVKVAFPNPPSAVPFTPTCVMELDDGECPIHHHKGKHCDHSECRHVFVINRAKVKDGHVVFYVSSKDIDKNSTNKVIEKIKKIPQGEFHHARFDIDGLTYNEIATCDGEFYSCMNNSDQNYNKCNLVKLNCIDQYYGWGLAPAPL